VKLALAPTPEAAVDEAIGVVLGELGDAARRERIRRLTADLRQAESSGEQAGEVAVFVTCEYAGEG
jgi:ribosome biogenesis SPOUT family RNA methylase Rps3